VDEPKYRWCLAANGSQELGGYWSSFPRGAADFCMEQLIALEDHVELIAVLRCGQMRGEYKRAGACASTAGRLVRRASRTAFATASRS
jgi:hypothetical protein